MKISVIIPVYNRAERIKRAVESVLRQTYTDYDLIIVDDGSDDQTPQVLAEYAQNSQKDMQIITFQENRGVSAARNAGIQAATGDWIALLDSDDEWDAEKLDLQVVYHLKNPELVISQCNERWIRNGKRVNKRKIHRKKSGRIFEESLKLCLISPSAVLFQRDLIHEVGLFDESFPVCEDYDYWLRVLRKYPVGLLDKPLLTRYGGHSDQLSSKYWGMDRWRVRAMEKHVDDGLSAEETRAVYRELLQKLDVLYQGAKKREKKSAQLYREKILRYKEALKNVNSETNNDKEIRIHD